MAAKPEPIPLEVVITRSARRQKTVGAHLRDDHTVEIIAPVEISDAELAPIVDRLVRRVWRKVQAETPKITDGQLQARAEALGKRHLGRLPTFDIRFVTNQLKRYGSCTPSTRAIRISNRLMNAPDFVLDYVIVHELAHLKQPNHSTAFWQLVNRYPLAERARGYLMAMGLEPVGQEAAGTNDDLDDDPMPPAKGAQASKGA